MLSDALRSARDARRLFVVCDVSPPRSAGPLDVESLRSVQADALCCAYLPGRAVRLDSIAMAHLLNRELGAETIACLATRDMNRLALSAHLLGAATLGVDNVVVLAGDEFTARDQRRVRAVRDTTPTQLLALIARMNAGHDFRNRELDQPAAICAGAALDPDRDLDQEIALMVRKIDAGASFFLSEPIHDASLPERFAAAFRTIAGHHLHVPVLWGLTIPDAHGVTIAAVTEAQARMLAAGCSGEEIALGFVQELRSRGIDAIYLIPPILPGGRRKYDVAARVLQTL